MQVSFENLIPIASPSTAIEILDEMAYLIKDGVGEGEYAENLVRVLFQENFTDYNSKAEKWLEKFPGVFTAIGVIKEQESFEMGQVYTDLSDPVAVCNSYIRIVAETILQESECYNTLVADGQCLDSDTLNAIFDDLVMIARELHSN